MQHFIIEQNIRRFRQLLGSDIDDVQRKSLEALLAAEQEKLAAAPVSSKDDVPLPRANARD